MEDIYAQAGHPAKYSVLGPGMVRLIGLFSPFMRELGEMHYLHTSPVIMDDSALRALLGDIRKTPYRDGIRQTLAALSPAPVATGHPHPVP